MAVTKCHKRELFFNCLSVLTLIYFAGRSLLAENACERTVKGMNGDRILVVDDEELNLFIIKEFLAQEALDLELFSNPLAAWERLTTSDTHFSAVIIDRMMPELDGLELLRRMKQDRRFADVPVIMQTAASSPDKVAEGLAAGAYYYLTKPYEPEALVSIVRAALRDRHFRMPELPQQFGQARDLVCSLEYRFASLDDVNKLVPLLAAMCPQPDLVAPGLADLMVNAVEHGNLALTYQEKSRLKTDGGWEEEIARRLRLPDFSSRYATVRVERLEQRLVFTIVDQGAGFDWARYLTFDPGRAFDPNGRGIAMARLISFSSLEYRGCGNEVVASVDLSE